MLVGLCFSKLSFNLLPRGVALLAVPALFNALNLRLDILVVLCLIKKLFSFLFQELTLLLESKSFLFLLLSLFVLHEVFLLQIACKLLRVLAFRIFLVNIPQILHELGLVCFLLGDSFFCFCFQLSEFLSFPQLRSCLDAGTTSRKSQHELIVLFGSLLFKLFLDNELLLLVLSEHFLEVLAVFGIFESLLEVF